MDGTARTLKPRSLGEVYHGDKVSEVAHSDFFYIKTEKKWK